MKPSLPETRFSLGDVQSAAYQILKKHPDPIPHYRLLREVLRLPAEDGELQEAQSAADRSKWVRQIQEAQLTDGSWGRFHSQDSKVKSVFRTSEEAIDRAFSLGLGPAHPVLQGAKAYIVKVLHGQARITDREEKAEAWPLLIRFILAGRLAQIEPANPVLDDSWECLAEVTRQAFTSGRYCLADEAKAYLNVANTHVPNGFLESQHALWILSARRLPAQLESQLIDWIWKKPDGMRYLRAPLSTPTPKNIAYWLRSMNILARFSMWSQVSASTINWLWDQRDAQGLWDFGSKSAVCTDFPISENLRQRVKRKVDHSTCILVLLRRWFD